MFVRFKCFGPLRRALGTAELQVEVPESATVEQVIQEVITRGGPEVQQLIYEDNRISGNLIVMLNKNDIDRLPDGLNTQVSENDEVVILPHVQGGWVVSQ